MSEAASVVPAISRRRLLNVCSGEFTLAPALELLLKNDVATPHLKKLLGYALAYDPDLRAFGVRANTAKPMIDSLQTQLTAIITGRWDIILKKKCFSGFSVEDYAFAEYKYSDPKKLAACVW